MAARERGKPLSDRPVSARVPSGDAAPSAKGASNAPTAESFQDGTIRWSPNGLPWPARARYLQGMPVLASGGLSQFTIDNKNGGADVYVKLCRPSNDRCDGLRHLFIPQGSAFTMTNVAAGRYEVRYRDLSTGALAKSEAMTLQEVHDADGTRYSVLTLTLYRVIDGNTSFAPLPEERF